LKGRRRKEGRKEGRKTKDDEEGRIGRKEGLEGRKEGRNVRVEKRLA
jgi:hypothetical protein